MLERVIQQIRDSDTLSRTGKIENIIGMSIEASGGRGAMRHMPYLFCGVQQPGAG